MKFGDHRDLCRSYDQCDGPGAIKIFGEGTKLIVVPLDTILDEDTSPKPSMFLPSASETNIDEAGTYLCLLEQFFPEAIKVYWKEKDHGGLLQSQQGDTVKINNTYMKLSWVTVARDAMTKELTFVVRHENNKGGVDQEIVFPPIKKVTSDPEACLEIENDLLSLQLTSTFASYTYLLLLLKSALHGAFITFCLCRWSAACKDKNT